MPEILLQAVLENALAAYRQMKAPYPDERARAIDELERRIPELFSGTPDAEHCQACGRAYAEVYAVPDHIWEKISPKPNGAGLLCPTCALERVCALAETKETVLGLMVEEAARLWREEYPCIAPAGTPDFYKFRDAEEALAAAVDAAKETT